MPRHSRWPDDHAADRFGDAGGGIVAGVLDASGQDALVDHLDAAISPPQGFYCR
jgi:hypothetical protein